MEDSTRKRKYETPTLERHGAVSRLTLGRGGSVPDPGQKTSTKVGSG